jgi:ketosteroid isomerase-like protein
MRRSLPQVAVFLCVGYLLHAQESQSIERAMARFIAALNNLDRAEISTLFAENATMFSPSPAERIEGAQFGMAWREQLEALRRRSSKTGLPYLNVQPQQMRIDRVSQDVAIVSFHLKNGSRVDRRTFVWRHFSDGWKIVHLHASTAKPHLKSWRPYRVIRQNWSTLQWGKGTLRNEVQTPLTRPNDFTNMPYAAKAFTELRGLDLYCDAGVRRALLSIDLAHASGRSDGASHVTRQCWLRPLGCASESNV